MHASEIEKHARYHLGEPFIELDMKSEWSSQTAGYRQRIRQYIFDRYCQEDRILNLEEPPDLSKGAISISHGKTLGGFAYIPHQGCIGFDIEEHRRLNKDNLKGYSANKKEESEAPTHSALWTAKEAAFKCLRKTGRQPIAIREIEIGDWKAVDADIVTCRILKLKGEDSGSLKEAAKGLVILGKEEAVAIFLERQTL